MNRFNYLPRTRESGAAQKRWQLSPHLRPPVFAILTTLALLCVVDAIDLSRLQAVEDRKARSVNRLQQTALAVAHVKTLEDDTRRLANIDAEIERIQHEGIMQANTLAWIGNRLPAELWLSKLQVDERSYVLEGSSTRLAAVGTALLSLRAEPSLGKPRLVSLDSDSQHITHTLRYTLTIETAPKK